MKLFILTIFLTRCAFSAPITNSEIHQFFHHLNSLFLSDRQMVIVMPARYPAPDVRALVFVPVDFGFTFIDYFIKVRPLEVVTDLSVGFKGKKDRANIVRAKCVVLLSLARDVLQRVRDFVHSDVWSSDAFVLIGIREPSMDLVKEVLKTLWRHRKAINVTVMAVIQRVPTYFTWNPFVNEDLFGLDPASDLFPNKIPEDFHKFPIQVGVTTNPPFVMEPEIEGQYNEGIEIRALKMIQKKFNFYVEYVTQPDGESAWLYAGPNNSIVGLFGLLDRCDADIIFHGIPLTPARCLLSDCLQAHITESVHLIAPLVDSFNPWEIIYRSFCPFLWLGVFVSLLFTTISTYYLVKFQKHVENRQFVTLERCCLYIFAINLNVACLTKWNGTCLRLLLAFFSFYAIITTLAYQALLFSAYSHPKPAKQLETLMEMTDANLIAYLFSSGKAGYNQTDHDAWNKILSPGKHHFTEDIVNILKIIRYNRTIFSQLPASTSLYEISLKHVDFDRRPLVHFVKKAAGPYSPAFFMSLGHPLRKLFELADMQLVEGGLYFQWIKHFVQINDNAKTENTILGPLSAKKTQAVFYILWILLCLSVAVFCIEVVLSSWNRRNAFFSQVQTRNFGLRKPRRVSYLLPSLNTCHLIPIKLNATITG